MSQYYYLLSSLPQLKLGEKPTITKAEFLAQCKGQCSKRDYNAVVSAGLNAKSESAVSFMKDFCHFRAMVNAELSSMRAQAMKKDEEKYQNMGDKETRISETVRRAVFNPSPLEGERIILGLYESFLNDRASNHYFDLDALLIYALRLDILSRETLFVTDEGNAEFNRLFGNLKKEIFRN